MKILADTNILFSAALYENSKPAQAMKHIRKNHTLYLTDYVLQELRRIVLQKRPDKAASVDRFLATQNYQLLQEAENPSAEIRDPKDAPILAAAIEGDIDIIISRDGHFLSLDIKHPRVMSAAQYLEEVLE
jgi:putative PIN family toxin of toxin-antitoxin system